MFSFVLEGWGSASVFFPFLLKRMGEKRVDGEEAAGDGIGEKGIRG